MHPFVQSKTKLDKAQEMRKHKQNRNKKKKRERRRSNWQRHSPSSICGLRNSCPRILPALQAENFSLEEAVANYSALLVTIQLDLAHCNAVSYADRHSRTQQQQSRTSSDKSVGDVASLQRRPVRLLSGCGDATRTMRHGRVDGPARPGPVDRRATRCKLLPLTSFLNIYKFFIINIYLLK